MAERLNLDVLLADPQRAVDVSVDEVPVLLDALAVQEGRCRLVRDLLTQRMATPSVPAMTERGEWLTVADVLAFLKCGERTVRRRMREGTWREGQHWFAPNGTATRFSRTALEEWQRTQPNESAGAEPGLAFGLDIPRGRRPRRRHLQKVA